MSGFPHPAAGGRFGRFLQSGSFLPPVTDVTQLLHAWRDGNVEARDRLLEVVYAELHRIAARQLRGEATGNTLETTALIHEAFLKLVDATVDWTDRNHFFAVAARAMRRVLVDHAKSRGRQKRGGGAIAVSLVDELHHQDGSAVDVVDLDEALTRLAAHDPRKANAIELHFFGGLSHEEVASATGVSAATVDRDLRFAKAWLHRELQDGFSGS